MKPQTESVSAAQSYSFTTAHTLQSLYESAERLGNTPTAWVIDGDMTAIKRGESNG